MRDISITVVLLALALMCALQLVPRVPRLFHLAAGLLVMLVSGSFFFWKIEVSISREAESALVIGSALAALVLGTMALVRQLRVAKKDAADES